MDALALIRFDETPPKFSSRVAAQWLPTAKGPRFTIQSPRGGYYVFVDEPVQFIEADDWIREGTAFSTGVKSGEAMLEKLDTTIEGSRWILRLEDDFDGEGSPGYVETTWSRAVEFLRRHAADAMLRFNAYIPLPQINPADAGSVDLFWEGDGYQLLMNFPATSEIATYYGRTRSNETFGGTVKAEGIYPEVSIWLIRQA